MPFIFQGEELGLPDSEVAADDLSDPQATRNEGKESRDVCRTPMPWDTSHINGFTMAPKAWLPAPPRPPELTVAGQTDNPDSPIFAYRSLIHLRKTHPEIWNTPLDKAEALEPEVLQVSRGNIRLVANLSNAPFQAVLDTAATPIFTSGCRAGDEPESKQAGTTHEIPPETSVILPTAT